MPDISATSSLFRSVFSSRFVVVHGTAILLAMTCCRPVSAQTVPAAELVQPFESRVSPFDVGNRSQLFIDRVLVRDTERVWFTQHQGKKHPANPLIKADQPWEGWRVQIFGSVLYDEQEQIFKMWYLQEEDRDHRQYFAEDNVTCYATSTDGIHWQKPLVGTVHSLNKKPHNAVAGFYVANVIKDTRDPDPSRRYKCIAYGYRPNDGYSTYVSPDGFNWKRFSKTPIAPEADVIGGFWDPTRKLYVAFPKTYPMWRGFHRRLFSTYVSRDFVNWTNAGLAWTTDLRDDAGALARIEQVRPILDTKDDPGQIRTEYYGIGVYPAESCTIGFPWVLTANTNAPWDGNQDGPQEIQLAVSRDLVNWERPFRTPVIGIGDVNRWDASYDMCASSALSVGDEVRLYYSGANYTHSSLCFGPKGATEARRRKQTSCIGLVTWKRDRFVSADTPAEGGVLTTVPIKFSGKRLEINASTKQEGHVVVELCDAGGKPLQGFDASAPFQGDDLRHVVTFGGGFDVAKLAGKPVVLRFHMRNASLYSFAFRD